MSLRGDFGPRPRGEPCPVCGSMGPFCKIARRSIPIEWQRDDGSYVTRDLGRDVVLCGKWQTHGISPGWKFAVANPKAAAKEIAGLGQTRQFVPASLEFADGAVAIDRAEVERRRAEREAAAAKEREQARKRAWGLWCSRARKEGEDGPVLAYLAGRGLAVGDLPGGVLPRTIGFVPRCEYGMDREWNGGEYRPPSPAVVACCLDLSKLLGGGGGVKGEGGIPAWFQTVHRIYIEADQGGGGGGWGKRRDVSVAKKLMGGAAAGACVPMGMRADGSWWGSAEVVEGEEVAPHAGAAGLRAEGIQPGEVLLICEGVETGLALLAATGCTVLAAISGPGMESLRLDPLMMDASVGRIRAVVVMGDHDRTVLRWEGDEASPRVFPVHRPGRFYAERAAARIAAEWPHVKVGVAIVSAAEAAGMVGHGPGRFDPDGDVLAGAPVLRAGPDGDVLYEIKPRGVVENLYEGKGVDWEDVYVRFGAESVRAGVVRALLDCGFLVPAREGGRGGAGEEGADDGFTRTGKSDIGGDELASSAPSGQGESQEADHGLRIAQGSDAEPPHPQVATSRRPVGAKGGGGGEGGGGGCGSGAGDGGGAEGGGEAEHGVIMDFEDPDGWAKVRLIGTQKTVLLGGALKRARQALAMLFFPDLAERTSRPMRFHLVYHVASGVFLVRGDGKWVALKETQVVAEVAQLFAWAKVMNFRGEPVGAKLSAGQLKEIVEGLKWDTMIHTKELPAFSGPTFFKTGHPKFGSPLEAAVRAADAGRDGEVRASDGVKAGELIVYRNGVLNAAKLRDEGKVVLEPHSPLLINTSRLPYTINAALLNSVIADAERRFGDGSTEESRAGLRGVLVGDVMRKLAPHWVAHQESTFEGDLGTIAAWAMFLGSCLVPSIRHQRCVLLVGPPGAGKGENLRGARLTVGEENYVGTQMEQFAQRFAAYGWVGKLVLGVDESLMPKDDAVAVTSQIKRIVAGTEVNLEKKAGDSYSAALGCKVVMAAERPPRFSDPGLGMSRRLLVLGCAGGTGEAADERYGRAIEAEGSGISHWAVLGLWLLYRHGCVIPQPSRSADQAKQFERLASPISAFLEDCTVVSEGSRVQVSLLFDLFAAWCQKVNFGKVNAEDFVASICSLRKRAGVKEERKMEGGVGVHAVRTLANMRIRESGDGHAEARARLRREDKRGGNIGEVLSEYEVVEQWESNAAGRVFGPFEGFVFERGAPEGSAPPVSSGGVGGGRMGARAASSGAAQPYLAPERDMPPF